MNLLHELNAFTWFEGEVKEAGKIELELGECRTAEGVFFGASSLSAKCASGFGILLAGVVVDYVGLETGMAPEEVTLQMQNTLGLVVGLAAVILMITGLHPADLIAASLPSTQPGLFSFFVVGGIISPVAEEIFFRGVLYGYFRRWGMWAALLLSTAVFVMAHAIFHRVPVPQIVGGILFAVAYEKEKNLMVPITIHVLGNLAIFTLSLFR